jgi:hypothetical protein
MKRYTNFDLGWTFFMGICIGMGVLSLTGQRLKRLADKVDGQDYDSHVWIAPESGCYQVGGNSDDHIKGDIMIADFRPVKVKNEECR